MKNPKELGSDMDKVLKALPRRYRKDLSAKSCIRISVRLVGRRYTVTELKAFMKQFLYCDKAHCELNQGMEWYPQWEEEPRPQGLSIIGIDRAKPEGLHKYCHNFWDVRNALSNKNGGGLELRFRPALLTPDIIRQYVVFSKCSVAAAITRQKEEWKEWGTGGKLTFSDLITCILSAGLPLVMKDGDGKEDLEHLTSCKIGHSPLPAGAVSSAGTPPQQRSVGHQAEATGSAPRTPYSAAARHHQGTGGKPAGANRGASANRSDLLLRGLRLLGLHPLLILSLRFRDLLAISRH